MPRANAQPVRLSNDLLDATKQACALSGRSVPMEIEHRLRESLERGAWADIERQMPSDIRAFGHLVTFMINELGAHEKPQELKAAAAYLIDRVYGKTKREGPSGQAEMRAEGLWLRLFNAEERTYKNGVPIPMTSEQRALAEIRSNLGIGETTTTKQQQKKREAP